MKGLDDYWVWASGFYLTEEIPLDMLQSSEVSKNELDDYVFQHASEIYKDLYTEDLWELIDALAISALKTFGKQ